MPAFLPDALKPYAKLIVALGGAAVAIVGRHAGVDSNVYLDVVALATAAGVYAVPNTSTEG